MTSAVSLVPATRAAAAPALTSTSPSTGNVSAMALAACSSAADFVRVAGQGPICQADRSFVMQLNNGRRLTVAPPDMASALAAFNRSAPLAPASVGPVQCVPAGTPRVELYYAHFAGAADNFAAHAADIQQMFRNVDADFVAYDANQYFGVDAHLNAECDGSGNPVVHDVALSTSLGASDFATIASDMQRQGHNQNSVHYWIWTDGNPMAAYGYAGQSSIQEDDSAGAANSINTAYEYSVDYGYTGSNYGPQVFAHENGHAMGAVQLSAPDSTGAFHCTDGLDVMCYNDGGPHAGGYTPSDCGNSLNGTALFDCHFNDYFNPAPVAGSYLATHWNVGSQNNHWVHFGPVSTTTSISATPSSTVSGGLVLVNATVMAGLARPSVGTVTFSDGGTTIGSAAVSNGFAQLRTAFTTGTHTLSATYSGQGYVQGSSSTTSFTETIVAKPWNGFYALNAFGSVQPLASPALSGAPYWSWRIARGVALDGSANGGVVLDGWGGLHPFGNANGTSGGGYWPGWDITRGIAANDSNQGYVLDAWGGIHPFRMNSAALPPPAQGAAYWRGHDIARGIALFGDGSGGVVLDGWGGVHPFTSVPGTTAARVTGSGYWPGWDIARGVVLAPGSTAQHYGGFVLDGWGGIHPFGSVGSVPAGITGATAYWRGWDIARGIVLLPGSSSEGYVIEGWGGVHPFGGAPVVANPGYKPGTDFIRGLTIS